MRLLVLAYGYDGNGISESLSSYNLVQALKQYGHAIKVLTKDPSIEAEATHIKCKSWLSGTAYYRALKLDYFEFIARAYLVARRLVNQFDVIHHISPISFRYPNPLCNLGKPFIWGPIGGSIDYPPGFAAVSQKEPFIQRLRRIDQLRLSIDPSLRNTMARAARIVVTSTAAQAILPARYRAKSIVIPEGIALDTLPPLTASHSLDKYIFCSGRLVPYKGIDLLIKAFAQCTKVTNVQLWITGDGLEKESLLQLIRGLNLGDRIKLLGRVPKPENLRLIANALFCVFPALNEAFGHVDLEAMAAKKAIIVTDWGGPADIVEDGVTGFKVLGNSVDDHIALLTQRMAQLLSNDSLRQSMGDNALHRVKQLFSWEVIAKQYDQLYKLVTS